jgi:hypothetical protein
MWCGGAQPERVAGVLCESGDWVQRKRNFIQRAVEKQWWVATWTGLTKMSPPEKSKWSSPEALAVT